MYLFLLDPPLCKWNIVASACCYADTCTKEYTNKGRYSNYKRDFKCYEQLHNNWKRRADVLPRIRNQANLLRHNELLSKYIYIHYKVH